jgi:hypothetical protein
MSFQSLQNYFGQFITCQHLIIGAVSIALGMFLLNWISCFHQHVVSPYFRGWYGVTEWAKLRGNYKGVPIEWGSFLDGTLLYIVGIICLFAFYYQFSMKYNTFEMMEDAKSKDKKEKPTVNTGSMISDLKEMPPTLQIERRVEGMKEQPNLTYNPTENIPVEPMWSAAFGNFSPTAAVV